MESKLSQIMTEAGDALALPDYAAFNGLWICLVKMANLLPGVGEEHEQIVALFRRLPRPALVSVTMDAGVDQLLELDPPLETIVADPRERMHTSKASRELERIRSRRKSDPKAAMASLFEILQRIRDKREHGFKTPNGQRDATIIQATVLILRRLCAVAADHLNSHHYGGSHERDPSAQCTILL